MIWYKFFGYFDFFSLKQYLKRLGIKYINNSEGNIYDSCQRAKVTKMYNCQIPQQKTWYPYQFIYTNLVGLISPITFGKEQYFFIFMDDFSRHTETYTRIKKVTSLSV